MIKQNKKCCKKEKYYNFDTINDLYIERRNTMNYKELISLRKIYYGKNSMKTISDIEFDPFDIKTIYEMAMQGIPIAEYFQDLFYLLG